MNQSKIAVRYAKAFYQLATEKGKIEEYRSDINAVDMVFCEKEMQLVAGSPTLKISEKKKVLSKVFEGKISDDTLKFLHVITENKREIYIPSICRNFIDRYRNEKGIKAAIVTTAADIDDNLKTKVSKVISEVFKTQVELSTVTDEKLMGGFILRVGDQQIDASVATKLNNIKRKFIERTV